MLKNESWYHLLKLQKERFIEHFGDDQNKSIVLNNFSFELIYQRFIFAARCVEIPCMV